MNTLFNMEDFSVRTRRVVRGAKKEFTMQEKYFDGISEQIFGQTNPVISRSSQKDIEGR